MTFDEAMEQQTKLGLEKQQSEEKDKRDKEKAQWAEDLEKLDALSYNEHFKWFSIKYLLPMVQEQHEFALDVIGRTPEQRNNAAQQHYRANEMFTLLARERQRIASELATL